MFVIRRLQPTDASPLAAFFSACAGDGETRRFFHPHPLTAEYAADLCRRISRIRDRYFVAGDAGFLAGYALLRGWDEGYAIPSFGGCVHPQKRNGGLGHRLMAHCIDESRNAGAEWLRLTVACANERGIHLYRKFGFNFEPKDADNLVGLLKLDADAWRQVSQLAGTIPAS